MGEHCPTCICGRRAPVQGERGRGPGSVAHEGLRQNCQSKPCLDVVQRADAIRAVDALAPVLASMRQQWQQEGRNQAAEAIEDSDYFAVPSTRLIASYVAGLARGSQR